MIRKAFKYRLYPTKPQRRDLERTLALCRDLYNAALIMVFPSGSTAGAQGSLPEGEKGHLL